MSGPESSGAPGRSVDGGVAEVTDAFAAARGLLEGAEAESRRIRDEAEQHARTRSQEAELLVAKARRVLAVAEEKAAAIIAVARSEAEALVVAQAVAAATGATVGPVDATGVAEAATGAPAGVAADEDRSGGSSGAGAAPDVDRSGRSAEVASEAGASAPPEPSGLDRVLAAAIASAVDQALDPEGLFRR